MSVEQRTGPTRHGLLGGSFDPVHRAHIALANHARRHLNLDTVTLIPAAQPWQRGALRASAEHRLEMLRIAVAEETGLDISTVELERSGPTYTLDTLKSLPSGPEYFWILGADQLANFCTWKGWKEIAALVQLVVAARPGSELTAPAPLQERLQGLGRKLHTLPMQPSDISATEIRRRLAQGLDASAMLHPGVAQYIQQHQLYVHPAA